MTASSTSRSARDKGAPPGGTAGGGAVTCFFLSAPGTAPAVAVGLWVDLCCLAPGSAEGPVNCVEGSKLALLSAWRRRRPWIRQATKAHTQMPAAIEPQIRA